MKKILISLTFGVLLLFPTVSVYAASISQPTEQTAAVVFKLNTENGCKPTTSFLGIPAWYKYLQFDPKKNCDIIYSFATPSDKGVLSNSSKIDFKVIWLIALAVVEALLVISGMIAFVFVIVGGFKFITAQGAPDQIANARKTILNALIGAAIAILGSQIVAFIAGSFVK